MAIKAPPWVAFGFVMRSWSCFALELSYPTGHTFTGTAHSFPPMLPWKNSPPNSGSKEGRISNHALWTVFTIALIMLVSYDERAEMHDLESRLPFPLSTRKKTREPELTGSSACLACLRSSITNNDDNDDNKLKEKKNRFIELPRSTSRLTDSQSCHTPH